MRGLQRTYPIILVTAHMFYRLRQRSLGTPLQQPLPVPERGPLQPHHGRLCLCRWVPGLALRRALRPRELWQGLPVPVPMPQRSYLRPRDGRMSLRSRIHGGVVSWMRGVFYSASFNCLALTAFNAVSNWQNLNNLRIMHFPL